MAKFLYVLVAILSALVTVWCSLTWTLYIAVFLGFILLLLLLLQKKVGGVIRVRQKTANWSDNNDSTVKKIHKGNNSRVDQEDNNSYKGHSYLKRKNSVNRNKNHKQNLGSESEDEEIRGSVRSTNTRRTTTLLSIMSDLEKSISKSRLKSLFSVFNKGSGVENDRPASSAGRYNNKGERRKNGRQANRSRSGMAVGGDGRTPPHMSPLTTSSAGCSISRLDTPRMIGSTRLKINTGYDIGRTTVRHAGADKSSPLLHQRQKGSFAKRSPITPPSSPVSTYLLPRFQRTVCESPDRPGINPIGFTLHALQRPEVCYPSNSSPGMLPHVRLEKRIKIPLVESNINKMRSPVTVRIAPPETGVLHSPKFTSLKQDLSFSVTPDTTDVLLALREGTRKRTNAAGSDEDSMFESGNNTAKRRRQESNHSTASSSSLPSLPDFLPDLSLCNFTPSSYMSPNSRYMVASSSSIVSSSSGPVTNPASGLVVSSDGINSGLKRPVAPNTHLSQVDNSPNSKRQRQEMKNNPILSSLSSSQRYRLRKKESVKRKAPDSPELQDPITSKENQDTYFIDNQQTEKQASKTCKLSQSLTENTTRDTDINQTSVSTTTTDSQTEETQASTSGSELKIADLKSRRKHLSFASPGINLNRLSYANVYATKQDYENDRKAEQERVEKMLNRIATEKKSPDEDILSEKNVVGRSEESSQITTVLTIPSPSISSSTKALTCTTAANSLIVSSTTASLTSSNSSSLLSPKATTTASTPSTSTATSLSIFSSSTSTPVSATIQPSASPLSSLLQATTTSVTSSSTTTSTTIPQVTTTTTTTGLVSSSTKPTETSTSLTPTRTVSATTSTPPFQPMFGGPAITSTQSANISGHQFEIKPSSPLSSSIPSTTSSLSTSVTSSSFSFGTFSTANATSSTPAPISTTTTSNFVFGGAAGSASPLSSAFTTSTAPPTTNAGSTLFSSPSKDPSKSGGFSFTLLSPQTTPTSFATQKLNSPSSSSSLFSVPKTQISSASSPPLFPFAGSATQTFTTATTTSTTLTFGGVATAPIATAATSTTSTPAAGGFAFGQSTTSASLPQSSTTGSTAGIFTFKPNTGTSTTSSTSIPTSNPAGSFTFKGSSTSATTQPSNEANLIFGASGTKTGLTAFTSSSKPPSVFGASTSPSTFSAASSKFGASLTTSTPTFGAASTSTPTFDATSSAPKASFGAAAAPPFGMTSSTSTPVFGGSSTSTSTAFASPTSTTSTLFGSTNQPKPTFGATSSPFGASSTPSTAFSGATTAFGAPSSTNNLFGASTSQSTQANTNSTGSFAFNSSSSTPQQTSSTTAPTKGFNFSFSSTPASQNTFNFGGSATSSTTTATGTTTTTTTSTATAGSTSIFGGQASSTFSRFSSVGQDGQKSVFGSSTGNNSTGFNFNRTSTNQTANVFGQTGQTAQGSLFSTSDQQTNQPFTFGQGSTPGNATTPFGQVSTPGNATTPFGQASTPGNATTPFGQASTPGNATTPFGQASTPGNTTTPFGQASTPGNTTTPFGQASTPGNATTPFGQASTPGNTTTPFGQSPAFSSPQASSFGSFGAKPNMFATPTNNNDKPSQPAPNIFASTPASVAAARVAAQPKPLFGQASSQPFGTTSSTPSNTGSSGLFGATAMGQASTPATAAAGSTAPGIFTFGQSPGTQQPANPSQGFDFSASLAGPSQFNFGQAGTHSKPMFNMGSGSTAPKMRSTHTKTRRRGAKK